MTNLGGGSFGAPASFLATVAFSHKREDFPRVPNEPSALPPMVT